MNQLKPYRQSEELWVFSDNSLNVTFDWWFFDVLGLIEIFYWYIAPTSTSQTEPTTVRGDTDTVCNRTRSLVSADTE